MIARLDTMESSLLRHNMRGRIPMTSVCGIFAVGLLCLGSTLNAQTHVPASAAVSVSIPVLVELSSGEVAFGLSATDFSLKDNGIEQQFHLDNKAVAKPVALILVIQTGRDAMKGLSQIAQLADTVDSFLAKPGSQIAILTFDGSPHLLQEFTSDPELIRNTLASISKGNSRAALFDAVDLAIGYFRRAPAEDQREIYLISGEHDHGSVEYDMASVIHAANSSDVSIDSFTFRSGGVELFGRFHAVNPLNIATSAMEKNTVATLAELTGGEFIRFRGEADLQNCADRAGSHLRNRYILTFEPSSPQPGFHALQVAVQAPGAKIASARDSYWISEPAP